MYRFSPLGFSSRDGQVDSTAYMQSQQEIQQRQLAERTAYAEQTMMQVAREIQMQKDMQLQREAQERQANMNAEQQREAQRRYDEQQTRDGYVQELFRLTASAANLHGHQSHPELSGASAGNIHSDATLMGRDWAAQQNAAQEVGTTLTYHEDAPVIVYRTDMPTTHQPDPHPTDMARLHHGNVVGAYATNAQDVKYGDITGSEGQRMLSLPKDNPLPTHIVDVSLPIGTFVEASRPISGEVRQYKLFERVSAWFSNSRKLG
ncbi:MAG: hypothetical protein WAO98_09830 [Alphaproteobacteria bacterium]